MYGKETGKEGRKLRPIPPWKLALRLIQLKQKVIARRLVAEFIVEAIGL